MNKITPFVEKYLYIQQEDVRLYKTLAIIGSIIVPVYGHVLKVLNPEAIELLVSQYLMSFIMIVLFLMPTKSNKTISTYYGIATTITIILLIGHIVWATWLNGFNVDYILGLFVTLAIVSVVQSNPYLLLFQSIISISVTLVGVFLVENSDLDKGPLILSLILLVGLIILLTIRKNIHYSKLSRLKYLLESKLGLSNNPIEDQVWLLANMNEELNTFNKVLSHDLRTPVRNISTVADWLLESEQSDENMKLIKIIKQRSLRMDGLLEAFIQYRQVQKLRLNIENINVKKEISSIVEQPKYKDLTINVCTDIHIQFNIEAFHLIVNNLLSNVVHHNAQEGIKVSISCIEKPDGDVHFTFTDNGVGVHTKYKSKIFEMFQTLETKDKTERIGNGLFLIKRIIQDQGGDIWMNDEYTNGLQLEFTVPQ